MLARKLRACIVASAFATLFLSPAVLAADAQDASCWQALEEDDIPGFVGAEATSKPTPRYPSRALHSWSEGWVLLEHGITAEGAVRDIAVVDAMGPPDFVKESVRTVARWRYKPATRNGRPVEQFLHRTSVLYLMIGSSRDADHNHFVRRYNRARTLIREGDHDGAIATLEEAFTARLNLYEEAMGSYLLAVAFASKADWPSARYHASHAFIEDGKYLEDQLKAPGLVLLVDLLTRDGRYGEALCAFEDLRKTDPASAAQGTPAAKIAADVEAALKNPAPLGVPARLAEHPLFDAPAVWRHRLLRSKFSFADIKGEVRSFRLVCVGTTHEGPVDAETRWDVPAQAGTCILRVDGAPGATFTLVEEN